MITLLTDFGTAMYVARNMEASAGRAVATRSPMLEIAADMVRVTDLLWRSEGERAGIPWEPLAEETIAYKGNAKILYTEGSNPKYTPHPGEDILANSVTQFEGAHQVLLIGNRKVTFGTDLEYAGRQFRNRPFIAFLPTDVARWKRWIADYITAPFKVGTPSTPTRIPAGGALTGVPSIGGGFMLRGGNPKNIGQFSGVYGR